MRSRWLCVLGKLQTHTCNGGREGAEMLGMVIEMREAEAKVYIMIVAMTTPMDV